MGDVIDIHSAEDEWEEPVPLTTSDVRTWPDLLPGAIGDFAKALSESTETPPEMAVNDILGVLATSAQGKYEVRVNADHTEPLAYWGLTIQPPATRKSSIKSRTLSPLVEWETEQYVALKDEIREAKSKHKTELKIIEGLRSKAGKAKTTQERKDIAQDISDMEAELTAVPTFPRLWTDDITPERLATLMSENNECMGILSAEGGVFGIMAGRYSGGSANLNIFLKGHAGDAERVDRGSRDPVHLNRPALSMALSVQPEVLRGLAKKSEFRGCGLLARFVYALPNTSLGKRTFDTKAVSGSLTLGYTGRVKAILEREWNTDPVTDKTLPYVITIPGDAYTSFHNLRAFIEGQMADGGNLEHIRDWAGKLPGLVARVAALVHIARHATVQPEQYPISVEDMDAAVAWGQAVLTHALAVFDFMGADVEMEDARHILKWLKRRDIREFKLRDCHYEHQRRFPKSEDLHNPLRILADRHYIRLKPREKKAGRPSVQYQVNPLCKN